MVQKKALDFESAELHCALPLPTDKTINWGKSLNSHLALSSIKVRVVSNNLEGPVQINYHYLIFYGSYHN